MGKRPTETSITSIFVAIGLLFVAIPGLWMYRSVTARPLHPNVEDVPSVRSPAPLGRWARAAERARQIVRAGLKEQNLPGVSVAVGVDGEIVWAEGFGFADVDQRVLVTPDHRFRIGTASTVLTSAAVGLLVEQGRLKLDEVIQTYVPRFPKKRWPVTLRQLMGHVAGVKNDGGDEGPLFSEHCGQAAEALPHFAESSLRFEPGTRFRYSSYGWILLSAAVEAAAAKPLLTFMREQIFDPVGMHDTLVDSSGDKQDDDRSDAARTPAPNEVTSYFPRFAADPHYGLDLMRDIDLSCYAGAGAFVSTPSDLARYGMAINRGKLLQPATVRLLQTSQRLSSGEETGYGLGWDLETVTLKGKPTLVAGHDGETLGGMVATLMTFPEQGMVVSLTSNTSYAGTFSLAGRVAEAFADGSESSGK